MRIMTTLKELGKGEDGGFLGTAIILALVFAVMGIIIIDGTSVYYTWQSANDVTEQAARLAAFTYNETRSDSQAENKAADLCEENGMVFTEFRVNRYGHTFDIGCSKDADTLVFKYLPVFKDLIHQDVKKSSDSL